MEGRVGRDTKLLFVQKQKPDGRAMREHRLLERIQAREKEPNRRSREDPSRAIDSILLHLQRMLNTRHGSVPIAEDYGVPDFTSFLEGHRDTLRDFERSIRLSIQKFEPRLKAVRVSLIADKDDPLSLRFQILGQLASKDNKNPVFFESIVGDGGKITLKG